MGRSQNRFMKQLREKKKLRKRKEKEDRKKERQENATGGSLDEMTAYVDEFGNITSKSPEEREAEAKKKVEEKEKSPVTAQEKSLPKEPESAKAKNE